MDVPGSPERNLNLLKEIGQNPDVTQAGLAVRLGVAVGTVNWHLKRLVAKGYVKVRRAERRKLRYILTPAGIALRTRLTVQYVERSMALYRQVRQEARKALAVARAKGYSSVCIDGKGDVADVCRLTCLEQGMPVVEESRGTGIPVLEVRGDTVRLREPDRASG